MIARFEDTRDLRLMGGYQAGADAELDQAVIAGAEDLRGAEPGCRAPSSEDAFPDLAEALRAQ